MKVTMLLADAAQAVNGKLYILGGGWNVTGPTPTPSAIALYIEVPWDQANRKHEIQLTLTDGDERPVMVPTPSGELQPLQIGGGFEVGRPPGVTPGSPLAIPVAINIGPIPLQPGGRYIWRLSINGQTQEDWQLSFTTRPAGVGGMGVGGMNVR